MLVFTEDSSVCLRDIGWLVKLENSENGSNCNQGLDVMLDHLVTLLTDNVQ